MLVGWGYFTIPLPSCEIFPSDRTSKSKLWSFYLEERPNMNAWLNLRFMIFMWLKHLRMVKFSMLVIFYLMSQLGLRLRVCIKWSMWCCRILLMSLFCSFMSVFCLGVLVSLFFLSRGGVTTCSDCLFGVAIETSECVTVNVLMLLCVCVCACVIGPQFCFMHNDLIHTQTPTYRIRLLPQDCVMDSPPTHASPLADAPSPVSSSTMPLNNKNNAWLLHNLISYCV